MDSQKNSPSKHKFVMHSINGVHRGLASVSMQRPFPMPKIQTGCPCIRSPNFLPDLDYSKVDAMTATAARSRPVFPTTEVRPASLEP